MTFYEKFKTMCDEKGTYCSVVAREIGLSNSITTKWKKTNAVPRIGTLFKIADYFEVDRGVFLRMLMDEIDA